MFWAAVWLLASTVSAAEPTVGERGDPQRLTVEGATTFPANEIRRELFRDFAILLAAS